MKFMTRCKEDTKTCVDAIKKVLEECGYKIEKIEAIPHKEYFIELVTIYYVRSEIK